MNKKCFLLYFFIFFSFELCAFSLTLNNGKTNGNDYYVIHLENSAPFSCKVKIGDNFYPPDTRHDGADTHINRQYFCFISGDFSNKPQGQKLPFMDLEFKSEKDGYWVIIKPKILSRIFSIDGHLYSSNDTKQGQGLKSRHYTVILNENISQSLSKTRPELDFPIIFPNLTLPYIGALDFNKEPLSIGKEDDINDYINIKKLYEAQNYIDTLKASMLAIKNYPSSVFLGEFMLHYLRSLDAMKNNAEASEELEKMKISRSDEIIKQANIWVKNFASDKAYPEVLYMLMKGYLDNDSLGNAEYMIDLLKTEHESSPWTQKALLAYADFLANTTRLDDAILLYEDVLYATNDIQIASQAAMQLAATELRLNRLERASMYLDKILTANPSFLAKQQDASINLAQGFKEAKLFENALKIYELILKNSDIKDEIYELALRNLALSPADDKTKQKIFFYLKKYQKEFPNSQYLSLIDTAMDRLFFDINKNQNKDELQKSYAQLMQKYKGSQIGKRALLESASLSFNDGDYKSVLNLRDEIREANDTKSFIILQNSAIALANDANTHKACARLMLLIDEFSIASDIKDKYKLFACYIQRARYKEALELTSAGIESGDLRTRVEWLSNASQALFNLGLYNDALKAANDAIYEARRLEYSDPSKAIFYRFFSLLRLDKLDLALTSIDEITKLKGTDFMYIQMCDAAATYASANNFHTSAIKYAKMALQAQARLKIDTFSPQIDFIYIDSLKNQNLYKEAMVASARLIELNLKDADKARALYTLADLQLKDGAREYAQNTIAQCLNLKTASPWQELCKQQSQLLKNDF